MKTPGAFTTILLILTLSCTRDELPAPADSRCIVLRWVPAYETENWQQVKAGMRWSFSFLGATLPPGSMQRAISRIDEQSFELALEPLGFTEPALHALEVIIGRLIDSANQVLNAYRSMLSSDLDFEKQPEHTQSELLYISFMEPSAQHVAREWGWPLEEVELLLSGNSTHTFPEFPFLGQLHHRRLIDSLAPYGTEAVPGSVREPNGAEPNYFN